MIASESSVGSGLRRIEALTGPLADAYVLEQQATIARLGRKLNATPGEIEARVEALQAELEAERRRLQQLERQAGRGEADALLASAEKIGDASLLVARVTAANVEALREMGDVLREKLGSAVIVLGAVVGDRPNFLVDVDEGTERARARRQPGEADRGDCGRRRRRPPRHGAGRREGRIEAGCGAG